MIDREARDRLVDTIESYLDERITAFQFDEAIFAIESEDETIRTVVCDLWQFYDDCTDHSVALSKEEWDYIQRLLLLLRSNAELCTRGRRVWSCRQFVAAFTVLCFLLAALPFGLGEQLFIVAMPFGLVSIVLSKTRRRPSKEENSRSTFLAPYASVSQVLAVRRGVPSFRKRPYPLPLANSETRGALLYYVICLNAMVMWMMVSPMVLLFQMLPRKEKTTYVRLS